MGPDVILCGARGEGVDEAAEPGAQGRVGSDLALDPGRGSCEGGTVSAESDRQADFLISGLGERLAARRIDLKST